MSGASTSARTKAAGSAALLRGAVGPARLTALLALALACLPGAAAASPTGTITEYPVPTAEAGLQGIAPGPEGNVWFTEFKAGKIGRVTPGGGVAEFAVPTPEGGPTAIATGPDGNLWFTENGSGKAEGKGERIGRITPAGAITEFATRSKTSGPEDIVAGPDGNLWFTESSANRIGRITPAGEVAEFPTEHSTGAVALGPDGNLWFTEPGGNRIGRITPTGTIVEFPIPPEGKLTENSQPEDIVTGPDGNLWFTENRRNMIGRITPAGAITQFPIPTENSGPLGIAAGADGNVWFTEYSWGGQRTIGRITPAGTVAEFLTPTAESGPFDLAPAADGNVWFTEHGANKIGLISAGAPEGQAAAPTVAGGGLAGMPQTCGASWNAWSGLQANLALYPFDGYRWLRDGGLLAAGPTYVPTVADVGHTLTCTVTATYPLPYLVTTAAAGAPLAVTSPAPTVTALAQSAHVWRTGFKLAQLSARRHRPPVGTTFSLTLNEPASLTLSFTQPGRGRKVGGRCVAPTRRNRSRRACTRSVTLATLSFSGHPGLNQIAFQGRLSRRGWLRTGTYRVLIVASSLTGNAAAPRALTFTITR